MSLVVQDAIVTLIAMGALGVLIDRVRRVFFPRAKTPACGGCSTCQPRATAAAHSERKHATFLTTRPQ
jgi:hypothetical protein